MTDVVTYAADDAVATLTIDDGKANALGPPVLEALLAALDRAEEEGLAVLLTGREGMFSAGFDLKVFQSGEGERIVGMLELGSRMMHRVFTFPRPVVIAAGGHAMAAGAFMLLAADLRIGAEGAFRVGLNETQIGLTLPWPVIELARYRLSRRHLDESVVAARIYSPQEAVDANFLDRVAEPSALLDEARAATAQLAALHAEAYAGNKSRLRGPAAEAVEAGIERMLGEFRQALAG